MKFYNKEDKSVFYTVSNVTGEEKKALIFNPEKSLLEAAMLRQYNTFLGGWSDDEILSQLIADGHLPENFEEIEGEYKNIYIYLGKELAVTNLQNICRGEKLQKKCIIENPQYVNDATYINMDGEIVEATPSYRQMVANHNARQYREKNGSMEGYYYNVTTEKLLFMGKEYPYLSQHKTKGDMTHKYPFSLWKGEKEIILPF